MTAQPATSDGAPALQAVRIPHDPDTYDLVRLARAQPGVEYLFCLPSNLLKARQEGWETVPASPLFSVAGELCLLMYQGTPTPGGDPYLEIPRFFQDPQLPAICPPAVEASAPAEGPQSAQKAPTARPAAPR